MSLARLVAPATLSLATLALAACSSSSSTDAPSTAATSSSAPVTSSAPASTTAAPSTPVTTTTVPPSSSAPRTTTAAPSTSAAPQQIPFTTTCRSLRVDVVKGGAIRGMEIAAVQFTNTGSASCTVTGRPTATLLRNGAVVGSTSKPNKDAVRPYTLKPGDIGESLVRDYSTCDAPLSDELRFRAPSRNGATGEVVTRPLTIRACTLSVAPVGEPS